MKKVKKVSQSIFSESPEANTNKKIISHRSVTTTQYWIFGSVLHNLVIYFPQFLWTYYIKNVSVINNVYFNSTLLSVKLETKIRIYRLDVTHTVFPPYLSCEHISSNIISLRNTVSEPKLPPLIQLG